MTNELRETVVDRVRKLLALAGNNTSVNEAAAAAAAAQRLMLEHRLAAVDVESNDTSEQEEVGELSIDETGTYHATWKSQLIGVVARASCCSVFQSSKYNNDGKKYNRFVVCGTPSETSYVSYAYAFLVAEIERLCNAEGAQGRAFKNSFRRGAVTAIAESLRG